MAGLLSKTVLYPLSNKAAVRAQALSIRNAISPAAQVAGALSLGIRLGELPELQAAEVVASYEGIGSELQPRRFVSQIEGMPKVVLPRVSGERALTLHHCTREELVPGAYGIPEPNAEAHPVVDVADVDVILVPGLAFDCRGHRLGYGKGYYDSLLANLDALPKKPLLVGISYDETLFDELPIEDHDIRMDVVVTPTQILRLS